MIPVLITIVGLEQRPGMAVAEIGVWDGETYQHWVPIVSKQKGRSVLVDNFLGNPKAIGVHALCPERRSDVAELLKSRLKNLDGVCILEGDSATMSQAVEDESLDVCFIDADHRYSKVSADIKAWLPKVKTGGILCGHDCQALGHWNESMIEQDYDPVMQRHHGVVKAVSELVPDAKLLLDWVWFWRVERD